MSPARVPTRTGDANDQANQGNPTGHSRVDVNGPGTRFGAAVNRAIQLLLDSPHLRSRVDDELRHFVLARFPYSIVYAALPELDYLVAVAHGSCEPGYWQLRVQEP